MHASECNQIEIGRVVDAVDCLNLLLLSLLLIESLQSLLSNLCHLLLLLLSSFSFSLFSQLLRATLLLFIISYDRGVIECHLRTFTEIACRLWLLNLWLSCDQSTLSLLIADPVKTEILVQMLVIDRVFGDFSFFTADRLQVIVPVIYLLEADRIIVGNIASIASYNKTVVLIIHDLGDLADLRLDHFDAVASPSVVVDLYHTDKVLLDANFTALLLKLVTFKLLISDEDQQLSAELMSANCHSHRYLPEARALRCGIFPQIFQPVSDHGIEGLFLPILLHLDNLDFF